MSLTKDYYTAAELAARQHRELLARPAVAGPEKADLRPVDESRRSGWRLPKLDEPSSRQLAGAWANGFVHG